MLETRPGIRNRKWHIANRKSAAGFTLIELIVSMGIMVFVISITVIAFAPVFGASGMKSATRVVTAALDGARIRAIQQRRHVRFEAQRIPGVNKVQWRVTSSAGDVTQEWKNLPEFLVVETNVEESAATRGDAGLGGTYSSTWQRISVTFAPDGSVVRCALGSQSEGPLGEPDEVTAPFALKLESTRDAASAAERPRSHVVLTPLTGAIEVAD